ncbi:MAG: pyridoxamine kinase [Kiritimatiellae bacterium]|nr:pyridoxamine kinase [Kiritimatiellia bacterium]
MNNGSTDHNRQRKAAVINDFSSFGRCSLAVTLPILSALKVQCCSVPTAIFTNHTGFEHFSWTDYTDHMDAYIRDWQATGLRFDAIATGFLGSARQIGFVRRFIEAFRGPDTLVFVDPVMGDYGRLYATYDMSLAESMREFLDVADVLTPNLTEACVLAGCDYDPAMSDRGLKELCEKLTSRHATRVVVSGISRGADLINYIYERGRNPTSVVAPKLGEDRSGTGDVFSSVILGRLVRGERFEEAVWSAADFVSKAVERTIEMKLPATDGLAIEEVLGCLCD